MFSKAKWEYTKMVVALDLSDSMLTDLGKDGWEAYASFPDPRPANALDTHLSLIVLLKRAR